MLTRRRCWSYLCPHHHPELAAIEAAGFDEPWTDHDFRREMARKFVVGYVALDAEVGHGLSSAAIGHVLFRVRPGHLELLRLAVHPDRRRKGVGRMLVGLLKDWLDPEYRTRIEAELPESRLAEPGLAALRFLQSQGFLALGIEKGDPLDSEPDMILMEYELGIGARMDTGCERERA